MTGGSKRAAFVASSKGSKHEKVRTTRQQGLPAEVSGDASSNAQSTGVCKCSACGCLSILGGVMCAEGMVGGATSEFLFLDFFLGCDSSGVSGHRLNPQITIMTVSTTCMKDSIRTL